MEWQRRVLEALADTPSGQRVDTTVMETGVVPPLTNFRNHATVTIRLEDGRRFYVPRTFAGDRLGKIIREAAINGLLDDRALEILRPLEDPLGQSLTRRRLNRIRIELAEYLETKVTGGGVRELFDFTY